MSTNDGAQGDMEEGIGTGCRQRFRPGHIGFRRRLNDLQGVALIPGCVNVPSGDCNSSKECARIMTNFQVALGGRQGASEVFIFVAAPEGSQAESWR